MKKYVWLKILIVILVVISGLSLYLHQQDVNKKNIKEYVVIKYDADENDIEDKTVEKGSVVGELIKPTKPGYKFLYWTVNDEIIDENFIVNENITIKAVFEQINLSIDSYVVVFNSNGSTEINNQIINKGEKVVKPDDPVKKGYIFLYWTYKDEPYDFDTPVTSDLALKATYKLDNTNDKAAPDLKLKGEGTITLKLNDKYVEPGYSAIDDYDGDITENVIVTNEVDTSKVGTYVITYTVSDEKGNSIDKTRTVIVEE